MPIPAQVFILDLDDTLIDTEKVKQAFEKNFQSINLSSNNLWSAYDKVKSEKGFVDYHYLSELIAKEINIPSTQVFNIFLHTSFQEALMPKAVDLIEYLQTLGKVIIFSQGHNQLQLQKIRNSGLEKIVGQENIQIIEQKKEQLKKLIKDLKQKGYSKISFIEDRAEILDEVYLIDKNINCYWMRNGKYQDILPTTSSITFQSNNLAEIYQFIYDNNEVAEIKTDTEILKINFGITSEQVRQLIVFSHQDKQIQQFTSDLKRFNNKESFNNWLNQGKFIYTLLDIRNNLKGIIWFSEKDLPEADYINNDLAKYHITIAIRIYDNLRGKGIAKQFMNVVLKNFYHSHEYKSILQNGTWAVIDKENIPSLKLHEKMGFLIVTKPDQSGKIVMVKD